MNRKARVEPFVSAPLSDSPWPVEAKNLLTDRERSLYQKLLSLYPEHQIMVQVALSQLIDVPEDHPERQSIRNRFSQLVADFVLCHSDLSVVCVIELDDRSHERIDRQGADARKHKALADAGIRLVRIPAGNIPSEEALRGLIDVEGRVAESLPEEPQLRLTKTVHTYSMDTPPVAQRNHARAESRALKQIVLKVLLGAVLLGGWLAYSQAVPLIFQHAFQPLAVRHVIAPAVQTSSASKVPAASISSSRAVVGPSAQTLAEEKRAGLLAAEALQKRRNQAWAAFYSAPTSCEHPVNWTAQVECGNQYMRAMKQFEAQWAVEHASDQTTGATVVLDNGSMGRAQN